MNSKLLIFFIIILAVSGCTRPPTPELELDKPEIIINAFELGALKIWNSQNPEVNVITIDRCNEATRIDKDTWKVPLKSC